MRISDWSSDVCSSDLRRQFVESVADDICDPAEDLLALGGAQPRPGPGTKGLFRAVDGGRHLGGIGFVQRAGEALVGGIDDVERRPARRDEGAVDETGDGLMGERHDHSPPLTCSVCDVTYSEPGPIRKNRAPSISSGWAMRFAA